MALGFGLVKWAWLRPKKLEKLLREQGLQGNPYRLLVGDSKSNPDPFDFPTISRRIYRPVLPPNHRQIR